MTTRRGNADPEQITGATAWPPPNEPRVPGRAEVWLRDFAGTVGWYLTPLLVLAVFAGPTRTVVAPTTTTPRPLWLLALALAVITASAAHIRGWAYARKSR